MIKYTERAELYLGVVYQNVLQKFGKFSYHLNIYLIRCTILCRNLPTVSTNYKNYITMRRTFEYLVLY